MVVPEKVVNIEALWQLSHVTSNVLLLGLLDGMCPVAPEGGTVGPTPLGHTPAKVGKP